MISVYLAQVFLLTVQLVRAKLFALYVARVMFSNGKCVCCAISLSPIAHRVTMLIIHVLLVTVVIICMIINAWRVLV